MSWLKKVAAAEVSGGGDFLKDGAGRVIIKDVAVVKTRKDKHTFKLSLYVKESKKTRSDVEPNAPGTSFSQLCFLNEFEAAPGAMKKAMLAIIGPDASKLSEGELEKAFEAILRPVGEDGHTDQKKACPARGYELTYETYRQETRDKKKELVLPNWYHVDCDEKTVAANLKLLEGVKDEAGEEAA